MGRINIYLEKNERCKLDKIKNRYHLSYSTISRIIVEWYYKLIPEQLEECYIYGKKGYKTSIKPRHTGMQINKPSFVYTNALKIFLNKDMKKYVSQDMYDKVQNHIYQSFENEWDADWNGSYMNRMIPKFIKNNKEYVKKILENEQ